MRDALQRYVEVPLVVGLLSLPRGLEILELGCGSGNALPALRRLLRPARLVGVDLSPGAAAVLGDANHLPFRPGSFDLVLDFGTCFHADPRALHEVARVLRPGGRFVHETRWAQRIAHPGHRPRPLDWTPAPELHQERSALLWSVRRRA